MRRLEELESYYDTKLNDVIDRVNGIRNKAVLKVALRNLIIVILITLLAKWGINEANFSELITEKELSYIKLAYFLITIVAYVFSLMKEMDIQTNEVKDNLFAYLIEFITGSEEIEHKSKFKVSQESFEKMELFNLDTVKYNGRNYTTVKLNNKSYVMADMDIYVYDTKVSKRRIYKEGKPYIRTTKRKIKRMIFSGCYIGAALPKKNKNQIYLIPNNFKDTFIQKNIDSYVKYSGEQINLEDLNFSKKYKVYCDDQVQSRYILTPSFMEKITSLDNIFPDKKYFVFKKGNRFSICLGNFYISKIKSIYFPRFRNRSKELRQLTKMYNEIIKLFEIYDMLDLDNNLYREFL